MHALQSKLWNALVSERLVKLGHAPVEGEGRPPPLATLPLTRVAVGADMAGDLVLVDASTKDVDMAGDEREEAEEETEMADGEEAEEATASGRARTLVSMPPLSAAPPPTIGCQPLPRPPSTARGSPCDCCRHCRRQHLHH